MGVAKIFNSIASAIKGISTYAGTPKWMSPEMFKAFPAGAANSQQTKSDIFSLGLIALYCLDTKEFLNYHIKLNNDESVLEKYLDEFRLRCPSTRFFYMLRCMLSYSPFTRPNIVQLFEDFPEFTLRLSSDKYVQTEALEVSSQHRIPSNDSCIQTLEVSPQHGLASTDSYVQTEPLEVSAQPIILSNDSNVQPQPLKVPEQPKLPSNDSFVQVQPLEEPMMLTKVL